MPNFVSPGAMAGKAIEEFFLQRAQLERQAQQDALAKTKQEEDLRLRGEDLNQRRAQQATLDANQDDARKALEDEREFRRSSTLVQNAMPGQRQTKETVGMLDRQGFSGAYRTVPGVVAQGPQRDEIAGVPIYDVSTGPETYEMLGGSTWLNARAGEQAKAEAATQAQEAAAQRAKEAQGAAAERGQQHDQVLAAIAAGRNDDDVGVTLSPKGLDLAASVYARGGGFPPLGMGRQGFALKQAIIDRAAQYDEKTGTFTGTTLPDPIAGKAGITANTQALGQLTKNAAAVSAFEDTVRQNSTLLRASLDKLPGGSLPRFLASPVRSLATQFGSEAMATFTVLRQSVQNEYARIINNPNLTGVLTDTARHEIEKLLNPDATVGQIKAALDALQLEAGNRRAGFEKERVRVQGELRAPTAGAGPGGEADPTARARQLIEDARKRRGQ